jgi:hypothetical protein
LTDFRDAPRFGQSTPAFLVNLRCSSTHDPNDAAGRRLSATPIHPQAALKLANRRPVSPRRQHLGELVLAVHTRSVDASEHVFDEWRDSTEYPTVYRMQREVRVNISRLFPGFGGRRKDELPLWVKAGGLHLEPWMAARQFAWLRCTSGDWLAGILMPAGSANGQSRIMLQLWVEPDVITTDLTTGT